MSISFCLVCIAGLLMKGATGIMIVNITATPGVEPGDGLWLNCSYDSGSESLYSLKWYKDGSEIYRYTPVDRPQAIHFSVPGVNIDMEKSSEGNIFIPAANISTYGRYRCEASSDAPEYATASAEVDVQRPAVTADLRITNVTATPGVKPGDGLWLNCTYNSGSEDLYALKWYKDNAEFYRYLPWESQRKLFFPVSGVALDRERSSGGNVFVTEVRPETYGTYRCEVSGDAPRFTVHEAEVKVGGTMASTGELLIAGAEKQYSIGETVNISCMAFPSYPVPKLRWFINDKEAPPSHVHEVGPIADVQGLEASIVGLSFEVLPEHLAASVLKFSCVSEVGGVSFTNSTEARIVEVPALFPAPSPGTTDDGIQVSAKKKGKTIIISLYISDD